MSMRRLPLLSVLLVTATGAATAMAAPSKPAPGPFTMNGWQLHEYNVPKLEEAVRRAPDYGVNFLIFSHELFRSVEGFLASTDDADPANPPAYVKNLYTPEYFRILPGWQSDLRHLGDLATAKGIPYYLWIHEFDDMPKRFIKDGRVDMDDPELFPYLEKRYTRLLDAMPGTAGFVLTLHECDFKVFRDDAGGVATKDDVPQRIRRVAQFFRDFLAARKKQLILRNFFYEPFEMESFRQALDKLPDDIIVMSKDTTHEFHPFYPWDPLHGAVGKKRQIIEIDLGVEKAWSGQGIYAQPDYVRRVALRAREKGLTGLVGRARLNWEKPFDDVHEVNLYAFSRFLRDPDLTVDAVMTDWARRRYPARAVPYVVSAMKRSEYIQHRGRWHLEYWLTKAIGTEWGDYPYYYSRVKARSRFKWSHDSADQALEEKLYHPDADLFHRLVAEKDEVVEQVHAGERDLRNAARHLTAEQMAPLREGYAFLLDAALLQREWIRAYFALRMFMDQPRAEYRDVVEDALDKMERQERTPGVTYGLDPVSGRRYHIGEFALEMRWRLANRARALAEDARILATEDERILRATHGGPPVPAPAR
jgi:hypothetical protein